MTARGRDIPCLACGVVGMEGRDVAFKVVEVPVQARREVGVLLPTHHASDALELPHPVPERYISEPRCRDEAACAERVRAQQTTPPAEPEPEPEPAPPDVAPDPPEQTLQEDYPL